MTEEIFNIQRKLASKDDLKIHPAELFEKLWDNESIKKALEKTKDMPKFKLDKIEIHPSGYCNMECPFCYGANVAPKKRKDLPAKALENILEDLNENMPEDDIFIVLAGMYSEPLKNPEINNFIAELGKYESRFALYTNGLLMNNGLINAITDSAKKTKSNKPSYVSFNVSASLYSDRFYKDLLPIIKKSVETKKKNKSPLQIVAPILAVDKKCYDYYYPIIEHLEETGVDNIRLSFPWKQIEHEKNVGFLSKSNYQYSMEIFKNLEQRFPDVTIRDPSAKPSSNCFVMAASLSISPEGDVYPCPAVSSSKYKKKFSYGSILDSKISDLWWSKNQKNLFSSLDPNIENCRCCPLDRKFNELCNSYISQI
ncbi:SPASM domain-containing protein [Candidatus Woesearchaeota archaeon]|nr:SPASM domain-containing protein [Candidatus Woesearchaeota archaeon]